MEFTNIQTLIFLCLKRSGNITKKKIWLNTNLDENKAKISDLNIKMKNYDMIILLIPYPKVKR